MIHAHQIGQTSPEPAAAPPSPDEVTFTKEQEEQILRYVKSQLELEKKVADIKESRSRRFWGAIGGLAAATTAIIGVLAFVNRK